MAARLTHSEIYRLPNIFAVLIDRDCCIKVPQDISKLPRFKISSCSLRTDTWDGNFQHSFRGQLSNSGALLSSCRPALSTCRLWSWLSNPEEMSACAWRGKVQRWNKNITALSLTLSSFFQDKFQCHLAACEMNIV